MRAPLVSTTHVGGLAHWLGLHLAALHLALLIGRAEEAWQPVLLGGLIPILGALGIGFLLWYAVRQKPEDDDEGDRR